MTRDEMADYMEWVFHRTESALMGLQGQVFDERGVLELIDGLMDDIHRWVGGEKGMDVENTIIPVIMDLVILHALADGEPLIDAFTTVADKCQFFRESGQKEYAHENDNAFGNFERVAKKLGGLGLTREAVLCVYLEKHLDGIRAWVGGHKSQRESVNGRICDAIVYLCLLGGMIHS